MLFQSLINESAKTPTETLPVDMFALILPVSHERHVCFPIKFLPPQIHLWYRSSIAPL